MNALHVPRWHDNPNLKIQVRVRQRETTDDLWNAAKLPRGTAAR
jgi:hypothetical protein